jgi:tryptophanyl-tRNA synthetase
MRNEHNEVPEAQRYDQRDRVELSQHSLNPVDVSLNPAYAVEVFTGIRPTGALTIANYVGAIRPTLTLLEGGLKPVVFVADLHALTTHEPTEISGFTQEVILNYVALGLDPAKADIFVQSAIAPEVFELTSYLSRHITVAELLRVPTLKDKVSPTQREESAPAFLALYPVMMAADILLQRAHLIPVGDDQIAHIELTRKLAERFNRAYGSVFPEPQAMRMQESARILGLQGNGKMGKSQPNEALFLTDSADEARTKIKHAKTGFAGEMNDVLQSHANLVKAISDQSTELAVDELLARHLKGEKVMSQFKSLMLERVVSFLNDFQERRAELLKRPELISDALARGNRNAQAVAQETINLLRRALREEHPESTSKRIN